MEEYRRAATRRGSSLGSSTSDFFFFFGPLSQFVLPSIFLLLFPTLCLPVRSTFHFRRNGGSSVARTTRDDNPPLWTFLSFSSLFCLRNLLNEGGRDKKRTGCLMGSSMVVLVILFFLLLVFLIFLVVFHSSTMRRGRPR